MNSFSLLEGTVRQTHDALIAGLVAELDRVTPDLLSTLSDGFGPLPQPDPPSRAFEAALAAARVPPPLVPQGVYGRLGPVRTRRRRSDHCPRCEFMASTTDRLEGMK